jgi:hypothetical protein
MPQRKDKGQARPDAAEFEETKKHVLAAGRELLLAARGALSFCKEYVESSADSEPKTHLDSFFKKALLVADELGKGLSAATHAETAVRDFARSAMGKVEKEMRHSCRRKTTTKKRGARSRAK